MALNAQKVKTKLANIPSLEAENASALRQSQLSGNLGKGMLGLNNRPTNLIRALIF